MESTDHSLYQTFPSTLVSVPIRKKCRVINSFHFKISTRFSKFLKKSKLTFLCVSLNFVIIVCRCVVLLKLNIPMTVFLSIPEKG